MPPFDTGGVNLGFGGGRGIRNPNPLETGGVNLGFGRGGPSVANPLDPEQSGKWLAAAGQEAGELDLFDPETAKMLQAMFQPYFQQQQKQFLETGGQLIGRETSRTGMNVAAQAAQRGVQPGSFVNAAQRRVQGALMPQMFQGLGGLKTSQMGQLLNAIAQSGQFKLAGKGQQMSGLTSLFQAGMTEQMQPEWWETAISGALGAAGQVGGALLMPTPKA